jgi:hypothetical protein
LANTVDIVITATDTASKVIAGIANGLTAITDAVGGVTSGFIAYGDQVRELSNFVGTSNEETSRMIQLADDAFVSFETLRMASKQMSEGGVQPTTENVAKLSDQFLKLQPGLARSQFLIDKFGRAGIEMTQIMQLGGSEIRKMSASIEDSMIIDDEKAASIYKTKQSLDAFNDRLEGMKFDVADRLLTIFQDMPQPLQDTVLILGAVGGSGLLGQMANLAIIAGQLAQAGGVGTVLTGMGTGARALGAGIWTAIGPISGLIIAISALAQLVNSEFGQSGITAAKQLLAMGRGAVTGAFQGEAAGAASFQRAQQELGLVSGAGGSGGNVVINYTPQSLISTGTPAETQQAVRTLQQLLPQTAQTGRR